MIHVAYCFDRQYQQHFGASVTSLLLNDRGPGSDLCIHVVTDEVGDDFRAQLGRLTDTYRARVEVHVVRPDDVTRASRLPLLAKPSNHLSPATYYRVLLADMLPPDVDRVVYLDADTIVLASIRALYEEDLGPAVIGAVLDRDSARMAARHGLARYVNTGVMVVDLQRWRQGNYAERCFDAALSKPEKIVYGDQCAINMACADGIHVLDPRWNRFVLSQIPSNAAADAADAAILHFITGDKPWQAWYENRLAEWYWRYLDVSPWAGAAPLQPATVVQARRLARLRFAEGKTRESVEIYEQILASVNRK